MDLGIDGRMGRFVTVWVWFRGDGGRSNLRSGFSLQCLRSMSLRFASFFA